MEKFSFKEEFNGKKIELNLFEWTEKSINYTKWYAKEIITYLN